MTPEILYLDSSAILKLVVSERETPALLALLARHLERASSSLARVEVARALRRSRAKPSEHRRADDVFARIALIRIDDDILEAAAALEPRELRSLDAIHIATALSIRSDLAGIVSYDEHFTAAADRLRLPILSAV